MTIQAFKDKKHEIEKDLAEEISEALNRAIDRASEIEGVGIEDLKVEWLLHKSVQGKSLCVDTALVTNCSLDFIF